MAGGWTRDGAVQDQIDDTVTDAVLRARGMMPTGDGSDECDDCGEVIPKARDAHLRRVSGETRRQYPRRRDQPSRQQGQPATIGTR